MKRNITGTLKALIAVLLLALLGVAGCGSSDNTVPLATPASPASSTPAPAEKKTGGGTASMNAKNMTVGPGAASFGSKSPN